MGAYSNPQGFVDTQTGQYYREITASIANAVSSIAQTYKQNQEEIRKINLKVGEEESALNRELSSTQQANPTVNFEDLYRPQIKRYAELRASILNGTSKDPSADRMEADKIFSSVANIKNSLIDLSAEGFDEKYAKLGSPGGYAIDENNPSTMKAMLIFSNKLKGVKKGRFEDGDPNRFVWDIYDADNNLVATMSAEKIKQAANGNGLLYTIPDAEKPIIEVKKSNPTIFELEKGLPTGNVLEEYLVQGEVIEKEIPGGKTIQQGGYQRTVKQYRPMAKVDKDKIAADPNFNALVQSTATGLTGGDSGSGTDAILFHNTHFKKMEGFEPLDISKPLTPEQKEKFIEDYKKFTLATIPNEQIIPNANLIEKDVTEGFKPIDPNKKKTVKPDKEAEKAQKASKELEEAKSLIYKITSRSGPQKIKANGRTVTYDPSIGFKAEGVLDAFQTKEEVIAYLQGTPTKPALTVKK
jgi:hypothetical protein